MGTDAPDLTPTQEKQVTIPVPEDRVPEFYAFYARFLAAARPGRRRGRCRGSHGYGCGGRHEESDVMPEQTAAGDTEPPQAPAA
ncbi:MAG: hypothetical protein JWO02_3530 [Solirubrobacterales bacterium]|nr:hypothetical protein [Solirubrobacterales bacterium]